MSKCFKYMKISVWIAGLGLITSSGIAEASKPIVAVFEIQNRAKLSAMVIEQLTELMAVQLTASGRYKVVPSAELKSALGTKKTQTYEGCYDEACQIEIGKELAAEKTLATKVSKLGRTCIVTMQLFDLRESTSEKAATKKGKCGEEDILELIDDAILELIGGVRRRSKSAMAGLATSQARPRGAMGQGGLPQQEQNIIRGGLTWVHSPAADVYFTKTEITVEQFKGCVASGACASDGFKKRGDYKDCNMGHSGRDQHPMNCVNWFAAKAYCDFSGGRLPTTDEWFAEASNRGQQKYPWGSAKPTCERAVMAEKGEGCKKRRTWPVCSKPPGNSSSGLCDMAGNVREWTASDQGSGRAVHGGAWLYGGHKSFQASKKQGIQPTRLNESTGFRCVANAGQ